ncbi:24293_t:CDS:2, partial [Gigaspora rosea]
SDNHWDTVNVDIVKKIKGISNDERVELDDDLEVKIIELIQMKQREEESVKMYTYRFDICAKQDLICWFVSGLNKPCNCEVMPLSLISFDAAKTIAEIIEKHLLEVENKEEIVGITNDGKR